MANECQVYFIRAATLGVIKIGRARCTHRRLHSLAGSSPDRLELLGIMLCDEGGALEKRLHAQFAEARLHGEWFTATEELLRYITDNAREPRPRRKLSLVERASRNKHRRLKRAEQLARALAG